MTRSVPDNPPPWQSDLDALQNARRLVAATPPAPMPAVDDPQINPTLQLLRLSWKLTAPLAAGAPVVDPEPAEEWAMVWRNPADGTERLAAASNEDLAALKMVSNDMPPEQAARAAGVAPGVIAAALAAATERGLILAPPSRIRRDPSLYAAGAATWPDVLSARMFTLQWHLTHACDLHCTHCYDRSRRSALSLQQGVAILDDLARFCRERNVLGHACLTGGNPLLYPHFYDLYRAASERGLQISVLGNAASREAVELMLEIQHPRFIQVSLEGLPEHNDKVRGAGYFDRVLRFLDVLRDLGVPSAVMLTLTRDNIGQVLGLAEILRDRAGSFNFNRLSPVGEGAHLQLPTREEYAAFLERYVDAAQSNPIMAYKDNLLNPVLRQRGMPLFDGCTGFGCGAAFNFLAVLPDGETHACRKFPSPVGNILRQGIAQVYDGAPAQRYRAGSAACRACTLRPVCGGCMAIASGCGLDPFTQRDPFCTL